MQTRKLNIALSLGTIMLVGASLSACHSNPFSAEKKEEAAKTDTKTTDAKCGAKAVKPADGKCGASKAEGKCGAKMDGKCGTAAPATTTK
jgi:uncharacterized low-complexity protein